MKVKIKPEVLKKWITQTKCFMCKHRFDKPVLLHVEDPKRDKFQPKFNIEYVFHVAGTHGIPNDIFQEWIIGSIYGLELTEFGIRNNA